MHLTFLDFIDWDYDVETPYQRPLGGSQSALCYLSAALAESGHSVSLVNHTQSPGKHRKVECLNLKSTPPDFFRQQDVLIILNGAGFGGDLRSKCGPETRIVLWTQHAEDQSAMNPLTRFNEQIQYDAIVCVSDWQKRRYEKVFGINPDRIKVMRNAIGPAFRDLFSSTDSIAGSPENPPVLVYTSTPFRGLELLVDFFPRIRAAHPEAKLKVFSSMKVYQSSDEEEKNYSELYERCCESEGIEYIGSVEQSQLAEELKAASLLAYPNIFAETSCISVMEAMAAGCSVVTSEYGALPETAEGFARLIPVSNSEPLSLVLEGEEKQNYGDQFVESVITYLEEDPKAREERLGRQVEHFNSQCTWTVRADQWSRWLENLDRRKFPRVSSFRINFSGKAASSFTLTPI